MAAVVVIVVAAATAMATAIEMDMAAAATAAMMAAMAEAEKATAALVAAGTMTAMSDEDLNDDDCNNGYHDDGQQQWRSLPVPVPIDGAVIGSWVTPPTTGAIKIKRGTTLATGGTTTGGTKMARGSRATGGTTTVTDGTMTATGGMRTGSTMTARGRKRQQQHHHQRTNRSTIVRTFTSPDTWTYLNITWVWAERRTAYRCSAKIFYLFPIL